jgi:hypothetical protein
MKRLRYQLYIRVFVVLVPAEARIGDRTRIVSLKPDGQGAETSIV